MAGNWTYFPPQGTGTQGTSEYTEDTFQDYTLPANTNGSYTDDGNTNPFGLYFGNNDFPQFAEKYLFFKRLKLIKDQRLWHRAEPTYEIELENPWPGVRVFCGGAINFVKRKKGNAIQLCGSDAFIIVNGILTNVYYLTNPTVVGALSLELAVDASTVGTVDLGGQNELQSNQQINQSYALSAGSTQTYDLHAYRARINATPPTTSRTVLEITGLLVSSQRAAIQVNPGSTYIDKEKITTTVGASLALPSTLSPSLIHLGGIDIVQKNVGQTYSVTSFAMAFVSSSATGASGTNTVTLQTGLGASFAGVVTGLIQQGSTFFQAPISSVLGDVVTLGTTLPFGLSGATFTSAVRGGGFALFGGPTNTIGTFEHVVTWTPLDSGVFFASGSSIVTQSYANGLTNTSVVFFRDEKNNITIGFNGGGLMPFAQTADGGSTLLPSLPVWGTGTTLSFMAYGDFHAVGVNTWGASTTTGTLRLSALGGTLSLIGSLVGGQESGLRLPAQNNSVGGFFQTQSTTFVSGIASISFYKFRGTTNVPGSLVSIDRPALPAVFTGVSLAAGPLPQTLGTCNQFSALQFKTGGTWGTVIQGSDPYYCRIASATSGATAAITFFADRFLLVGQANGPTYVATLNGASFAIPLNTLVSAPTMGIQNIVIRSLGSPTLIIHGIQTFQSFGEQKFLGKTFDDVRVDQDIDGSRIKDGTLQRSAVAPWGFVNAISSAAYPPLKGTALRITLPAATTSSSRTFGPFPFQSNGRPIVILVRNPAGGAAGIATNTDGGVVLQVSRNGVSIGNAGFIGNAIGAHTTFGPIINFDANPPPGIVEYTLVLEGNGTSTSYGELDCFIWEL